MIGSGVVLRALRSFSSRNVRLRELVRQQMALADRLNEECADLLRENLEMERRIEMLAEKNVLLERLIEAMRERMAVAGVSESTLGGHDDGGQNGQAPV